MITVKPKIRGFICTTAHPEGCRKHVKQQIDYVESQPRIDGPKNVLVIGASTGYGLASWISALFSARANAVGVFYERAASGSRTATAGWYNAAAVEEFANAAGLTTASVNGDAFSTEIKAQTCEVIKQTMGKIDLVIYSLASPRRVMPGTGEVIHSTLKPTGELYKNKTIDPFKAYLSTVEIDPATPDEIEATVKVMGGDDWALWMEALQQQDLLADGVKTVAYSYVGPEITYPIYRQGTIGKAKEDLEQTAHRLDSLLAAINGKAYVSVNKALVTQASAAIPVVPLYISMLYKLMKQKNIHEGCIEQIQRLYSDFLFSEQTLITDDKGRIRIDDLEMRADIQAEIDKLWKMVEQDNLLDIVDLQGYQDDFYRLFGFGLANINYETPIDVEVSIPSLDTAQA